VISSGQIAQVNRLHLVVNLVRRLRRGAIASRQNRVVAQKGNHQQNQNEAQGLPLRPF
jgi:hypothetical protein